MIPPTPPKMHDPNKSSAWSDNPFQAPATYVEDVRISTTGALLNEPSRLSAGRGNSWWSSGWALFREASGLWIGMCVLLIVIFMFLGVIPIVGSLATYVITPVITGGLMLGCRSLENGEGLSIAHLFSGFSKNTGQLAMIGVIYLAGIIGIAIVVLFLLLGGGLGAILTSDIPKEEMIDAMMNSSGGAIIILLGFLLGLILAVPLLMANWFAPALVILNDLSAIEAMKTSLRGCWRNNMPFLMYGLGGIFLAIFATIPFALGWLWLVPTMVCSTYVAYREIFLTQEQ